MTRKSPNRPGDFARVLVALIEWLRSRPPGLGLVKSGVVVLVAAAGGWAFTASVLLDGQTMGFRFADSDLPTAVLLVFIVVGTSLVGTGVAWLMRDQRRLSSRHVTVVEVRGLRNGAADPLVDAVPRPMRGDAVSLLIDLRQRTADGEIEDPAVALAQLSVLPLELAHGEAGAGTRECVIVYGGLAPVPMTFLTGMLIDDERSVVVMDWDRHQGRWRSLDEGDDGDRFEQAGIDLVADGAAEVALAVSVSYRVRVELLLAKLPGVPAVELTLTEISSENHWSNDKQVALGKQFLELVKGLGGLGVRRIHLFLAAPNSMVFSLGRLYDRRNLPELLVYQFDGRVSPPYPWAIKMPVSGDSHGVLVSDKHP